MPHDRTRVRTFVVGSLHFSNGGGDGNSGAFPTKSASHDFHHDQERRPAPLSGLGIEAGPADCLSSRLVAGFGNARLPPSLKPTLSFAPSRRRRSLPSMKRSGGNARIFGKFKP